MKFAASRARASCSLLAFSLHSCLLNVSNGAHPTSNSGASKSPAAANPGDPAPGVYDPCPPRGAPCRIMPLGDSITAGAGSTMNGSYRVDLFRRALRSRQSITFVGSVRGGPPAVGGIAFPPDHEGHSGYTIDDGGGRSGIAPLVAAALEKYRPHVVTLMIGTNDVDIRLDPPNAPRRLGALIDAIQLGAPDALVVLAQIVPTISETEDAAVVAYNAAMPALVEARSRAGKHIVLVDMHTAFKKNANFALDCMTDNLHPSDAGYAVMGGVWYAAIGPLFR